MDSVTKMERAQISVFHMVVVTRMKRKTAVVVELSRELLGACKNDPDLRLKKSAFTRERKLGAERMLHMLLHRLVGPLQLELDAYCEYIETEPVSKQAFSKARANLNPAFVRKFADGIAEIHSRDSNAPSWNGMRLIAIDGTDIALENSVELKRVFGCSGPRRDAATALGSLAYGPLDHAIYDCRIAPYATDERDLAKLHMERLQELGLRGSLLLFDRWYPSASFLAYTLDAGFSFVMRVREKWNLQVDAVKTEGWITLTHENKNFSVRVLKVVLSTGEIETLLTNLNQEQLPFDQAGQLYFKRWGIETAYDILKSKFQLENFSGKTEVSVLQDFYATIYLAGFAAICAAEADETIAGNDKNKDLKYPRKSNQNRTIAKLRDRFWRILLQDDPDIRDLMLVRLCADIAAYPVSVRPGRSPTRKPPRKKRVYMAKKSILP